MTRRDLLIAAIVAGAVLVLAFVLEHARDANRDRELEQLHGVIARNSKVRVAAVARTDTVFLRGDTATKRTARADSGWTRARSAADQVPAILAAAVHDTVKIRELVAVVDTLRIAGDSLARAAAADTAVIHDLRIAIGNERSAWADERRDLAHALEVAEARRRHWGPGATLGYGALRDNAGVIRAGPAIVIGLTYRW